VGGSACSGCNVFYGIVPALAMRFRRIARKPLSGKPASGPRIEPAIFRVRSRGAIHVNVTCLCTYCNIPASCVEAESVLSHTQGLWSR
jgi:hypothetical protein